MKQPGPEGNHSPSSTAEAKNEWRCTSTPPEIFMALTRLLLFCISFKTVPLLNIFYKSVLGSIAVWFTVVYYVKNYVYNDNIIKSKTISLQAWTVPESSRRLRLPDFKTVGTCRW